MCHQGSNANGDYFTNEVLQGAQFTPRYKPIDWEHGQPYIGSIVDSKYSEDASGRGYIEAVGVIWKFIYPELSDSIKSKSATGELKVSMECYFKDANYKYGDQLFSQEEAKEMGIVPYVGREYMGQEVYRVFQDVIFGGVGVVQNPADREAVFLAVAKEKGIDLDGIRIVASDIRVNDFPKQKPDESTGEAVTIARYVKAFDKAKSTIVSKFNKDEIESKQMMVQAVNNIMGTLSSEVSTISRNFYTSLAFEGGEREEAFANLSFSEIHDKLWGKIEKRFVDFDAPIDAYIVDVFDDHFIYEICNYAEEDIAEMRKMYKAKYSVDDDENVNIDFQDAVRVKQTYKEVANQKQGGLDQMTEEEIKQLEKEKAQAEQKVDSLKDEVSDKKEKLDEVQASIDELNKKVKDLETELASEKEAKAEAEEKAQDLEAKAAEKEKEAKAKERLADLEEVGVEFSEARQEKELTKLKDMSDEDYADYKEMFAEILEDKVDASKGDGGEVDVKNDNKSTANLNLESQTHDEPVPFGNLASK